MSSRLWPHLLLDHDSHFPPANASLNHLREISSLTEFNLESLCCHWIDLRNKTLVWVLLADRSLYFLCLPQSLTSRNTSSLTSSICKCATFTKFGSCFVSKLVKYCPWKILKSSLNSLGKNPSERYDDDVTLKHRRLPEGFYIYISLSDHLFIIKGRTRVKGLSFRYALSQGNVFVKKVLLSI